MWLNKFNILVILFCAFVLRLINLNQSLWHDESGNIIYAKTLDFFSYVISYPIGDFHPNGYFAILWVWGHVFGFSEISLRMPSVIFGILTIFLTYLIGKHFFSKTIGLIAAILLTVSPLHIYYSQEARMYSFAAFAATFSFFWLIKLVKKERFALWMYAISIALILYSDYVTYLVIFSQLLYIFFFEKRLSKNILLACFIGGLLASPTLLILPSQFNYGIRLADRIEGWKQAVGAATLKNYLLLPIKTLIGRISIDNKIIYFLIISLMSMPYFFLLIKKQFIINKNNIWLWSWLIIPVFLAAIISPFVPIFSYFRLLFILPAFCLLIAVAISQLSGKTEKIILGVIIISQLFVSLIYLFDSNFHREDWKGSVKFIENNSITNSLILFENDELFTGYRYYNSGKVSAMAAFSKIPVKSQSDLIDLNKVLINKPQIYLYEYLVEVTDPEKILERQLRFMGYYEKNTYNFRGIGFIKVYQCCKIYQ